MKHEEDDELYHSARFSIPQAARQLGVGPDTALREIKAGKLQAELRGKRMKCSQAAIDDYIDNQKVAASGEKETYVFKHLEV